MSRSHGVMQTFILVAFLLGLTALTSCRGDTVAVSGKVIYSDSKQSFPGGTITFHPIDESGKSSIHRPSAQGEIRPDGSFTVQTPGVGNGVVPGKYRVLVAASSVSEDGAAKKPALIDRLYSDPNASPVVVDVTPGQSTPCIVEVAKPAKSK